MLVLPFWRDHQADSRKTAALLPIFPSCDLMKLTFFSFSLNEPLSDTFMQRTKRLYADTRTAQAHSEATTANGGGSNLDKLNEDLQDVTRIMTKNMEDLLWRGDSLDREYEF